MRVGDFDDYNTGAAVASISASTIATPTTSGVCSSRSSVPVYAAITPTISASASCWSDCSTTTTACTGDRRTSYR